MWSETAEAGGTLERALAQINSTLADGGLDASARCSALLEALNALLDFPNTRLAAYGTLAPGQSNNGLLADVPGVWVDGTVEGERFEAHGYPAFKWRTGNGTVPVSVLTSAVLPAHWAHLDDFEGADYRRILVPVKLRDGTRLVANLYAYIGSGR